MNTPSINFSQIETLTGSNFKRWKFNLDIALGMSDIDYAITQDEPTRPIANSLAEVKRVHEAWRMANKVFLLVMKKTMTKALFGGVPEIDSAKEFMEFIELKFKESSKAETKHLMSRLANTKYEGGGSVREHLMGLMDIAAKLSKLKVPIAPNYLVHIALESLPFDKMKSTYNTLKEDWTVDDLITIVVLEENRTKARGGVVNVVTAKKYMDKCAAKWGVKKQSQFQKNKPLGVTPTTEFKCYFCQKEGHMKKNCNNYKKWFEKNKNKGNKELALVSFESNLVDVPSNSWWLVTGASIHIAHNVQEFTRRREPRKHEVKVFVGNGEQVDVEAIGVVQLKLDSGFILELDDVVLVPLMKRNLISVSRLSRVGFVFQFNKDGFALSQNSNVLATGFLSNGLYCLNYNKEGEVLMVESSEKRIRSEGTSTM
ncbi:hypothetical protein CerSpe_071180 [Prunus speciosa]